MRDLTGMSAGGIAEMLQFIRNLRRPAALSIGKDDHE